MEPFIAIIAVIAAFVLVFGLFIWQAVRIGKSITDAYPEYQATDCPDSWSQEECDNW